MSLDLLETPHIFTQNGPLTTRAFIRDAGRYGIRLDPERLRRLHERGELSPIAVITDDHVRSPMAPVGDPTVINSTWSDFRRGQLEGRIADPTEVNSAAASPRFDEGQPEDGRLWWNGLLYSRWQMLDADWIRARAAVLGDDEQDAVRDYHRTRGADQRQLALIVTVLEARYLPHIRPGLLQLRNFHIEEWYSWASAYDAQAQLSRLALQRDDLVKLAEGALFRARNLDPSGAWSRLIGRGTERAWKDLKGDLAAALDLRVAAEILMLFFEDLDGPVGMPVRTSDERRSRHPLNDRLSAREEPLDRILSDLGVSPHPVAVLLVEGETERRHAPLILQHLDVEGSPDVVQVVPMNGVNKSLDLVAIASAAPLLGERRGDHYAMIRPPCKIVVAVDPDEGWRDAIEVEGKRQALVTAIRRAVEAQAPDADTSELDTLVEIRVWKGGCYEYAHFEDQELLAAIAAVHSRPSARPGDAMILDRLAEGRRRGLDVKNVWYDWAYKPPKPLLADALWPTLRRHIDDAQAAGNELPQIAKVILETHNTALGFKRGTWSLPARSH